MVLFDTHFHLDDSDDATAIITRARKSGVEKLNLISCDLETTVRNIKIAREQGIYTTAGVHPLYTGDFDGNYADFKEFFKEEIVVGVGEVGLDYFYHKEEDHQKFQREVFETFMGFSAETGKPAIIHCRDAFDDCYRIIKDTLQGKQPFVIHCYTGDREWAEKFIELGGYISYSGIVTFNNASMLRESLKAVPLDRMLIETDSPYLAPVPHRGKRNEPAYVVHVLERIAFELAKPKKEIADVTLQNGLKVFGISNQ